MTASFAIPASFDTGLAAASSSKTNLSHAGLAAAQSTGGDDAEVKQKFQEVLGELMFGQMLKSMRRTVDKPAYFHGGRAEEVFTQQLDQMLAQKIAESSSEQFFGPMYELCTSERR